METRESERRVAMKKQCRQTWNGHVLIVPIVRGIESERHAGNIPEFLSISTETRDLISSRTPDGWDGKNFHGIPVVLVDTMELGSWQLTCEVGNE